MISYNIDREHHRLMPAPPANRLTRRRVVDYGRLAAAL
jgi:hypothetical protein